MTKTAIVVGSGAGGLAVTKELANNGFEVTIIESGSDFSPLNRRFQFVYPLSRFGLLGSEKTISRFFPHMQTSRASKNLLVVWGNTFGGSTTLSCGNILRAERGLSEIGLNLTSEFNEIESCIGTKTVPFENWRSLTLRMFKAAKELDLDPNPTPKAVDITKCASCGLCELGCAKNAKWDARRFLDAIPKNKVKFFTRTVVEKLVIINNQVKSIEARQGKNKLIFCSDVVVLAAGGLGTSIILKNSGIETSDKLWIDIVATLGGVSKGANQLNELPMLWFTKHEDYMISPYIDLLSLWFYKPWRNVSSKDRVGLMIKLADSSNGAISKDGKITKELTKSDANKLDEGLKIAQEIMEKTGIKKPFITGMLNGGHLGGTVPLTISDINSMKPSHLPENLWIADLSLIPTSQGMPTILLTSALALKVARKIIEAN
jgi:hypothetical protein